MTGTTAIQLLESLHFPPVEMSLSPEAKHLIDLAIVERTSLKDRYFGTEHLLLAITQTHPVFSTPEWNRDAHLAVLHALRRSNPAPWWHLAKHALREP